MPSSTTMEVAASTLSPTLVPSTTQVTTDSIVSDLGVVSFVLPADVGPDPMPMPAMPDFVVGYGKWFVECCYLKIALQNLDPPIPEQERITDFESNGMTWTVYDTGPRDGTTIMAKATNGAITVLVGAQVRFPDEAAHGAARTVVEHVARSVVVTDSKAQ
jgi:hypothetical protein